MLYVCHCFVSLVLQGEICDIDGTCVDAADDEIFKLTTKGGSLSVEREKVSSNFERKLWVSGGARSVSSPTGTSWWGLARRRAYRH